MRVQDRMLRRFGRLYRRGECVFEEGDQGRAVYYILTGSVRIEKKTGRWTKTLATLNAGEYFGEMAAFIADLRTAGARAVEDSYIAVIDQATFQSLLRSSGEVSFLILQEFAQRLKDTSDALNLATQAKNRLKALVFLLAQTESGNESDLPVRMAAFLEREPEEVQILLDWLETNGAIVRGRDDAVLVNREGVLTALKSL